MPLMTPDHVALVTALISLATTVVQMGPGARRARKPTPRRAPGARRRVAGKRLSARRLSQSG